MADITSTIASETLTILGGPATVQVSLDVGPKGDRGNIFFYGQGKPTVVSLPQTAKVYDMYVNLLQSDDEYKMVYQYIYAPGGPRWTQVFKLEPDVFRKQLVSQNFDNGESWVYIPIFQVLGDSDGRSVSAQNFHIQCTFKSTNPVASSVMVSEVTLDVNNMLALPILIKAAEFDGDSWSKVDGEKDVYLTISVI
jgi:hypothetical protein